MVNSVRGLARATSRGAPSLKGNTALHRTSNIETPRKKCNEAVTRESKFSQPC